MVWLVDNTFAASQCNISDWLAGWLTDIRRLTEIYSSILVLVAAGATATARRPLVPETRARRLVSSNSNGVLWWFVGWLAGWWVA